MSRSRLKLALGGELAACNRSGRLKRSTDFGTIGYKRVDKFDDRSISVSAIWVKLDRTSFAQPNFANYF
jgi:hypothetical protein